MNEQPATAAGRALLGDVTIYGPNADEVRQVILAIEAEAREAAMVDAFDDVQRIDRAEARRLRESER